MNELSCLWITRWKDDRDGNKTNVVKRQVGRVAWLHQLQCVVVVVWSTLGSCWGVCLRRDPQREHIKRSCSRPLHTLTLLHCAHASPCSVISVSVVFYLPVFQFAKVNTLPHLTSTTPAESIIRKSPRGSFFRRAHAVTDRGPCYEYWKERAVLLAGIGFFL